MKNAIGIDLGGTGVKGALVNENGEILLSETIETAKSKIEILDTISYLIGKLSKDIEIEGVGVGSPGAIDFHNGRVLDISGNVTDWTGTDIRGYLKKDYPHYDIKVDNDANCAGLCEVWIGAGKGYDSALAITLGTGLGGFLYWNGDLIRGERYRGSELGHTILYPNGRQCGCGQKGCTERYVSGTGLEENYLELTGKRKTGKEITRDYEIDENCKKTVERFTDDLATALVTFKNFFDPGIIIIGGGVINSSNLWWDETIKRYREKINEIDDMPIAKAQFLNSAGVIGAASLILNKYE